MKKIIYLLCFALCVSQLYADPVTSILDSLPQDSWGKKEKVKRHYPYDEDKAFYVQVINANNDLDNEQKAALMIDELTQSYTIMILRFNNSSNAFIYPFDTYKSDIVLVDKAGDTYEPADVTMSDIGTLDAKYIFNLLDYDGPHPRFVPGSRVYMFILFKGLLDPKLLIIDDVLNAYYKVIYDLSKKDDLSEYLYDNMNGNPILQKINSFNYQVLERKDGWEKIGIEAWIKDNRVAKTNISIDNDHVVKVVGCNFEWYARDYSRDDKPYNAHVRAYFKFRNDSSARLLGLVFDVNMYDSFGDLLYSAKNLKYQLSLNNGEETGDDQFWYWEEGYNSPYNLIWDSVKNGTIRGEIIIKKAAFDDGKTIDYETN